MTWGLGLLMCSLFGCATSYRGGGVVSPRSVPQGRLVQTFVRTNCTTLPSHRSFDSQRLGPLFVDFVQATDGTPFIVERGQSDSWLLISNSHTEGDAIVFQTIEQANEGLFREYHFAGYGAKPGKLVLSLMHTAPRGSTHWFTARALGPSASCSLVPVNPLTGAPLATYAQDPLSDTGPGWGYDGSSFKVGDQVFVDIHGRSALARVVQASGTSYYVRLANDFNDTGRWIAPSAITGHVQQ